MRNKIHLVDLKAEYRTIKKEVEGAIRSVIKDTAFVGNKHNKYVQAFEKSFASYIDTEYCVACGNGTDAIEIALEAIGVGSGDEVIVPALTWISTSEAVTNVGATPVFVDIDPLYYTIDPKKIAAKITKKTKAIIPVHLYGLAADMDSILKIARKFKLLVIEDCAQAHGAEYKGKKVGSLGDVATFSFFPGKNLGAYGDAGCITTHDGKIAERARLIANHGQLKKNEHLIEGRNSRMDGIQAAILSAKLPFLPKWLKQRRNIAKWYDRLLKKTNVVTPKIPPYAKHAFHLYVIRTEDRDSLKLKLEESGIDTGIHYPVPLPFIKPYAKFRHKAEHFPVSLEVASRILSLPMYPELTKSEVVHIVETFSNLRI